MDLAPLGAAATREATQDSETWAAKRVEEARVKERSDIQTRRRSRRVQLWVVVCTEQTVCRGASCTPSQLRSTHPSTACMRRWQHTLVLVVAVVVTAAWAVLLAAASVRVEAVAAWAVVVELEVAVVVATVADIPSKNQGTTTLWYRCTGLLIHYEAAGALVCTSQRTFQPS